MSKPELERPEWLRKILLHDPRVDHCETGGFLDEHIGFNSHVDGLWDGNILQERAQYRADGNVREDE